MLRGAASLKKSIILSTAIFIFFCCIPFRIFAENSTYVVFEDSVDVQTGTWSNYNYFVRVYNSTSEVRGVVIYDSTDSSPKLVLVSNNSFSARYWRVSKSTGNEGDVGSVGTSSYGSNTIGAKYYYCGNYITSTAFTATTLPVFNRTNGYNTILTGFYYTFGNGSVSPVPPINHGDLIDVGYSTNLTNSQQSNYLQMRNNKDYITWNGYEDSNGNQINTLDYEVEIQAYATEYEAQTKTGLLGLTVTDLQNYGTPVTIYEGSANRGEFSILWGDVADALNGTSTTINFWSQMAPHSYENMWYSNGWLYRIRLKTTDDSYIGDWQTIYTMASSPPVDAETVYNYYYYYGGQGITDDVVDVLYNINTSNNTSNVYYINGNQVDPSGGSSNWLETLLKFISDMIGKILDLFGNMFDSVLDFLLNLFEGFDPVGTFMNWWDRLKQLFNGIDLTLPSFNLPEADISSFSILVQKTLEIFTLNGLGFIIFIPLIVMIVRLFL